MKGMPSVVGNESYVSSPRASANNEELAEQEGRFVDIKNCRVEFQTLVDNSFFKI